MISKTGWSRLFWTVGWYLLNGLNLMEDKKTPVYLMWRVSLQETSKASVKGSPLKSSWNPMTWTLPLCQRRRNGLPKRRYFPASSFKNWIESRPRQQILLNKTQCSGMWFFVGCSPGAEVHPSQRCWLLCYDEIIHCPPPLSTCNGDWVVLVLNLLF